MVSFKNLRKFNKKNANHERIENKIRRGCFKRPVLPTRGGNKKGAFETAPVPNRLFNDYCIKGMESGYLKSSPLGALTLAIIIQITLRTLKMAIIGIPITMNINGIARTI